MFRFSIREIFLVTLIVAMGLGWAIDHRSLCRQLDSWQFRANTWGDHLRDMGWEPTYTEPPMESAGISRR